MARPRKAEVLDLYRHGISYYKWYKSRHKPTGERVTVFVCDRRLTQDQVDALAQYTNTYIARVSPAYAPEIAHGAVILAEHARAWRTAHTRE